jgi:integrase
MGEYLEQWLRDYAVGSVAPTTLSSYEMIIRVHLRQAMEHVPITRITPQAIQSYLTQKQAQGLSSTTIRHHYNVLNEALKHAVRWGLLARNPTDMIDPPRRRTQEMRYWDEEQVRLFLVEAKRSSRFYPLYLTAVLTGMRQGELLALTWKTIDLTMGTASVQRTQYRLGRRLLVKHPKSAKSRRVVALPDVLTDELRRLRDQRRKEQELVGDDHEDQGLVFCQLNGKPLHANNIVRRDFRKIIERARLPRIRFHDLRHSHATHLLHQGVNPKIVQERLGHSSPAFTLAVYSHVVPGMQEQAARRLAERLLGSDPEVGIAGDSKKTPGAV